jgi:uncharacterized membrane protein
VRLFGTSYPTTPMPNPKRPAAPKQTGPNYSTSTTTGIEPNVAAALSYILALVTGIIFLLMEKENRYIRFHAAQSIAVSVIVIGLSIGVSMISGVLVFIPVLGWVAVLVLTLGLAVGIFALWVVLMWKAYQGETWELPVAGGIARRLM